MDSYETRKIGSEISESIDYLRNNINNLYDTIDKLGLAWSSNEANQYISTLKEKNIPELKKLCEILEKYNNFINNVPILYETLDEIFSTKGIEF